mgnify:CR=1 FL=1
MSYQINFKNKGFSLIEIAIAIFLLSFLGSLVLISFININQTLIKARIIYQINLALKDEFEKIRVMDYEKIGILNGWPSGVIPSSTIINKSGLNIKLNFYIRNVDNPKDGTITSTPKDTAPADYKFVEIIGECLNCFYKVKPQKLSGFVAPKTVESETGNGSLFIKVIDAEGFPVPEANVKIEYLGNSPFIQTDITGLDGFFRFIDIPTGTNAYSIEVYKNGYSSDKTYPLGAENNPNPIIPHQTVLANELTTVTFQIDRLSNFNLNFYDNYCRGLLNVDFKLQGEKLIGQNPNVFKTVLVDKSDNYGKRNFSLEWDNYNFNLIDEKYILKGYKPYFDSTISIKPAQNYSLDLILASSSAINLLVTVLDENNNYLDEAEVGLTKNGNSFFKKTGVEEMTFNDWLNNFSSKSNNLIITSREVKLASTTEGLYVTSTEWLVSKTFDLGTSTSAVYKNFIWQGEKPENTSLKFQVSANNDNSTWNFVGPDETSNTFFETNYFRLPNSLNNKRYFRFKAYFKSEDGQNTPVLNKTKVFYSSYCVPSGQLLFQNLDPGSYSLSVNKEGFRTSISEINLTSDDIFKEIKVILSNQ